MACWSRAFGNAKPVAHLDELIAVAERRDPGIVGGRAM